MRKTRPVLPALLALCLPCAAALRAQSPAVSERRLDGGAVVLLAPRPGTGAVHAAWLFGAGDGTGDGTGGAAEMETLLEAWFPDPSAQWASGFWAKAWPGAAGSGRDIAAAGLSDWCSAEQRRLAGPPGQERLDPAKRAGRQGPDPLKELAALAMGAESWAALSDVSPERLRKLAEGRPALIVLVGDVEEGAAVETLNAHFSRQAPPGASRAKAEGAPEGRAGQGPKPPGAPGPQRRVVAAETRTEVLVGWKVPRALAHRGVELEVLAEILAGGPGSRMADRLVNALRCSGDARIEICPLDGGPYLFVARADVLDGHAAAEVERAMLGEVQRAFAAPKEGLGAAEVGRALRRLEAKRASGVADAPGMAAALMGAFAATGDWRAALRQAPLDARPEELAAALVSALGPAFLPERAFSLVAEADPIGSPKNQEYARLVSLLSQLHAKKGGDPGRRGAAVKETVLQFGQMPAEMRQGALLLLEAETAR